MALMNGVTVCLRGWTLSQLTGSLLHQMVKEVPRQNNGRLNARQARKNFYTERVTQDGNDILTVI